jgi:integrase
MRRERLTLQRISAFRCPDGKAQAFLWDTEAPRLAIRATASGAKSFIFEGKLDRQTIRTTIGDVRNWLLDDARSEARRLQTMVDQGIDPRADKADRVLATRAKAAAAKHASAPALDAWGAYVEARRDKWGARHLLDHEEVAKEGGALRKRGKRAGESSTVKVGALRPLLLRPLADITDDVVAEWLAKESADRPTHAALAFRLLRGFLNWCASHKDFRALVHADACTSRNVRDELPRARAKDDCLQREQLAPWFAQVRAIQNPVIAAFLQVLLLTGARREEVAGLQWTEVDFQWKRIVIRDKVEGERSIPMTPYVEFLLRDLKQRCDAAPYKVRNLADGSPDQEHAQRVRGSVFSSPTAESGRLQDPRSQHKAACEAAGIDGLTLHGLRRSFGTLCEWVEVPVGIVAQLMGHKPSATAEKHYRRRPLDLLRQWHTKIEAWILKQAGIEQPGQGAKKLRRVTSNTAA